MNERRPAWIIADDIRNAFDHETGEVDKEMLDACTAELGDKAEAYSIVCGELEASAKACDAERAAYDDRRTLLKERADRLRRQQVNLLSRLQQYMMSVGLTELKGQIVTTKIRPGSLSVLIVDAKSLPATCLVPVESRPDKAAIKLLIKSGDIKPEVARMVRGADSIKFS